MVSTPKSIQRGAPSDQVIDMGEVHPHSDDEMRAVVAREADEAERLATGTVVVGPFRGGPPQAPYEPFDEYLLELGGDRHAADLPQIISEAIERGAIVALEGERAVAFCDAYYAFSVLQSVRGEGVIRQHILYLGLMPNAQDIELFDNLGCTAIYLLFYGNLPSSCGIYNAALEYFRGALGSMDSEKRKRTLVTLMALAGELQNEKLLDLVPTENLALVADLLAQAHKLARTAAAVEPPPMYASRKRDPETLKRPTAMEWFDLHWRERVARGEVFANDLKAYDLKLYQALSAHQSREGRSLADLLPIRHKRKSQMSADELAAHRERVSERAAFRARRARQNRPKGA